MARPGQSNPGTIRFFELLLDQFRGVEGELPSATEYLLNAASEPDQSRRSALIRIAMEKTENAEVLAAILVHIAKGRRGRFSRNPPQDELSHLLCSRGIATDRFDIAKAYARKVREIELDQQYRQPYSSKPAGYLQQYVELEDRQIAVYEQLIALTQTRSYIDALEFARQRQQAHRNELALLLQRASSERST